MCAENPFFALRVRLNNAIGLCEFRARIVHQLITNQELPILDTRISAGSVCLFCSPNIRLNS